MGGRIAVRAIELEVDPQGGAEEARQADPRFVVFRKWISSARAILRIAWVRSVISEE